MGSVFKKPKVPKPEMPKPAPVAPMPDEAEIQKTARRRQSRQSRATGQQSTLLTTGGRETLGA